MLIRTSTLAIHPLMKARNPVLASQHLNCMILQPLRFTMPCCYQQSGGLLPRLFTLTYRLVGDRRFKFLWHLLSAFSLEKTAYPLGSKVRYVVRTFLEGNLGPRGSLTLR